MRVLVACERSGRVRDAFRIHGHDAWSCDLVPCDNWGPHLQGDARDFLAGGWDALVCHPPCTFLTRANIRGRRLDPGAEAEAEAFALALWTSAIGLVAVENPVGRLWGTLGKPHQVVQPWWFGDPYTKPTCLWLRGLPRLSAPYRPAPVDSYPPAAANSPGKGKRVSRRRGVDDWWRWPVPAGVRSWTGIHSSPRIRSLTFPGIALAMAEQWGGLSASDCG